MTTSSPASRKKAAKWPGPPPISNSDRLPSARKRARKAARAAIFQPVRPPASRSAAEPSYACRSVSMT